MKPQVLRTLAEVARLEAATLPPRREPQRILMCTPEYFEVIDVKNPYMEGNIGAVEQRKAVLQWEELRRVFLQAGHEVVTISGQEGLEDMVFAANQTLVGMNAEGEPYVLLSCMTHASRQREVPYYRQWFETHGYKIYSLNEKAERFEGHGDALWHPGRQLLWGGYGHRSTLAAYEQIAATLNVPVIALELLDPNFYHLDTCFCVLRDDAVLIYPGAFTAEDRAMIARLFPLVLTVSEEEATRYFACNALALDGRTVILQRGARETNALLRAHGFTVIEVETGEYLKSGGSVFCLKTMVY